MNGCIEQPLAPTLRGLPIARIFFDVRNEPRIEDHFAVVPGIEPAIEIEIGTIDLQIRQFGHALQGVQPLRKEHGIRFIYRRHGERGQHKAVVVDDREDLLALLMFVAGIADAIATFLRDGVGAIAMKDAEIEVMMLRQMSHTGDECLIERAIVRPFGEHFVDCRVVDHGGPVARPRYRQALPLHARVEQPKDQIEDAVVAQFAFRPAPGH